MKRLRSLGGQGRGFGRKSEQHRQSVDAAPHIEVAAHAGLSGSGKAGR
jgi:hypothetical protein